MDERLEELLQGVVTPTKARELCMMAVLYARIDLGRESDDGEDNVINVHLGRVLDLGMKPGTVEQLAELDWQKWTKRTMAYRQPQEKLRQARHIADLCLFATGQEFWVGRTFNANRQAMVRSLGATNYNAIAAYSPSWDGSQRIIYRRLGSKFDWYAEILGTAGVLIGFHPTTEKLLKADPVVTIEDFLDALARYSQEPSTEHWAELSRTVEARRWADPKFSFTLPPPPE